MIDCKKCGATWGVFWSLNPFSCVCSTCGHEYPPERDLT